jgi:hypothetical protein
MAQLPTPDDLARLVLQVFEHFDRRPGEMLRANNFVAIAAKRGVRLTDLVAGIERGVELGWLEGSLEETVKLTEAGYAAM